MQVLSKYWNVLLWTLTVMKQAKGIIFFLLIWFLRYVHVSQEPQEPQTELEIVWKIAQKQFLSLKY